MRHIKSCGELDLVPGLLSSQIVLYVDVYVSVNKNVIFNV